MAAGPGLDWLPHDGGAPSREGVPRSRIIHRSGEASAERRRYHGREPAAGGAHHGGTGQGRHPRASRRTASTTIERPGPFPPRPGLGTGAGEVDAHEHEEKDDPRAPRRAVQATVTAAGGRGPGPAGVPNVVGAARSPGRAAGTVGCRSSRRAIERSLRPSAGRRRRASPSCGAAVATGRTGTPMSAGQRRRLTRLAVRRLVRRATLRAPNMSSSLRLLGCPPQECAVSSARSMSRQRPRRPPPLRS